MAAYGIIANIALVATAIFVGIAQGVQPIISNEYGNKRWDSVKKVHKLTLITSLTVATLIYIFTYINSDSIISIFNFQNDAVLTSISEEGIKIYFIGMIFCSINIIKSAFLSAIENPRDAFVISILRGIVLIVPLVLFLSEVLGMTGVWSSFVVTELIVTIVSLCLGRYKKQVIASECTC